MDKKEEFLAMLNSRRSTYEKIHLKGAFFNFDGNYYPIKAYFVPMKQNEQATEAQYLDYGNLLLIEEWLDVDKITNFLQNIGNDTNYNVVNIR